MTIFHRFCAVFPLLLVIALLAACGGTKMTSQEQTAPTVAAEGAVNSDMVKVAILLPLSGQHAGVGQSMLQAAQLAVFDMGYDNFELMPQDTGGTPQGASAAAARAVDSGAQLILGPLLAPEVDAVKAAIAGRNINILAFSTDWTLAGGNTYIMGFLPFGQVERIADFAARKGLRRIAIGTYADVYGETAEELFQVEAQKRGIAISPSLSDPNGYDAVFIPAGGGSLNLILLNTANKNAQKLGTGLWDDPRVAAMPNMDGAWFAAPSPSARKGFETRYQSTYGAAPVRIATLAYDATALAVTLGKTGVGTGRGPAFDAASLTSPNGFAGVDGIMRFSTSGLIERGMAVLEIRGGQITEIDKAPGAFR